jgi:hypothetical protein
MKAMRVLWLMIICFELWLMLAAPALWDSKARSDAHRQYYSAKLSHESAPTPQTQASLEQSRNSLDLTKRNDLHTILSFEIFMALALIASGYAFYRSIQKSSRAAI